MNTYTKIGGPPWGAQKSTNRMSFCALRESGGLSDLALVASAFRPASLALSSKEKSLRRLSRLRDGLRQQGIRGYLVLAAPAAGLANSLLYSSVSKGAHSSSGISKLAACSRNRSLSRATQGFVYIFGSSMVMVISR
jgi:hypothetical protein